MDEKYLNYLYQRYRSGELNAQEIREWNTFVMDATQDKALLDLIDADWDHVDISSPIPDSDTQAAIYQHIISQRQHTVRPKRVSLKKYLTAAAAIAAILIPAGVYFFKSQYDTTAIQHADISHQIQPGKAGATLTLTDGTTINLSDAKEGELARQSGVLISKDADGQLSYHLAPTLETESKMPTTNNISTTNGETYRIRLPDGSQVWLNAASSIQFTTPLVNQGIRTVRLEGEGYFEIAKDQKHPFIVETADQKVQVLGTHFNISAYRDQMTTKTTLLEGSIKIKAFNTEQQLKPGQQALLDGNNLLIKTINAPQQAVGWKNEEFIFDNTSLEDIMKQIGRWYDVEIAYSDQIIDPGFGGSISRSKNIKDVLQALEKTQGVHFKIEGRRILVMP